MEPEVLFEDEDLYVCYKPAGMATQTASATRPDMVSYLRNYRAAQGQETYIGVIHRLDQPVEGLVVFAKNKRAAAALSKQVQSRKIRKQYLCIITDDQLDDAGTLEDFLIKDTQSQMAKVVSKDVEQSKLAKLKYRQLEEVDGMRLLEVDLHTGRFHQIRCQFANQKAPLLGDRKYGGQQNPGLCLCSHKVCFLHPRTGEPVEFERYPKGEAFQVFHVLAKS